ncbi:MAG TPA: hypothetical protein VFS17_01655 [Methylophilaceae bacterium]|nr:hypothetical protein [Methylophilaceae bacterium]
MLAKIVLCATSNRLTAGIWRMGKLLSYQVFQNEAQGHEDFRQFLQAQSNTPLYLLADDVEEDFRLETLPHTSGNARREMVERKLNQIYRGTIYRAAHFINREKEKRKDDRFLFIALNNTELIQPWMQAIEEQQAPLVGVYLLPMVSQVIVRRLKLMAPHILLTERLSSGLRQTYLHNGRLRVSRLAPIPPDAENKVAYVYVTETEKARLYLISQRYITRETALNVVLPSLDSSNEQLARLIEQENGVECSRIDLAAFARSLRLDPGLLAVNPELLHMHLLAIGNVPDNLAPSKQIKNSQLNFIRNGIYLTTGIILLAGLVLTGLYLKESFDYQASTEQLTAQTRAQENLYSEVAKDFPSTPIPSNDLKQAVEVHEAIMDYVRTPERLMQVVSAAIENAPEIQIDRIHWLRTNDTSVKDNEQNAGAAAPASVSSQSQSGGFTPDPTGLYQVAFINGEIRGFTGDYRAALESVNRLVEKLRTNPEVEQVTILQEPVNVSSFTSLQGSTAEERTAQQAPALFKLKIILKRQQAAAR